MSTADLPDLPAPRRPGEYSIALVCLGNICRSPMAEVVLSARVEDAGLAGRVRVVSAGTGGWHVGRPMDPRAAATLAASDYDPTRHRAQQFPRSWHDEHDLVLAMDAQNLADLVSTGSTGEGGSTGEREPRTRLFGDFDPVEPGGEVPDPYYGGDPGFEEVLTMVERTSAALVDRLTGLLRAADRPTGRPG